MEHYIIVKFKEGVNYHEFTEDIRSIFYETLLKDGINNIEVKTSYDDAICKYDLMIKMDLTPEALVIFEGSNHCRKWRERYTQYIENKVIFDC